MSWSRLSGKYSLSAPWQAPASFVPQDDSLGETGSPSESLEMAAAAAKALTMGRPLWNHSKAPPFLNIDSIVAVRARRAQARRWAKALQGM
jgi:hypothetical protein